MSRSAPQVSKSAPSGRRAGPESVGTATRKTEAGEAQGNVCFRCREQGHRAYECPQRQNDVRLNHMIKGDELSQQFLPQQNQLLNRLRRPLALEFIVHSAQQADPA